LKDCWIRGREVDGLSNAIDGKVAIAFDAPSVRGADVKWRAGDVLAWVNRVLLHRACPYDYSQPRVLIGTRVAGGLTSELVYYPDDLRAQAGREALDRELDILRTQGATAPETRKKGAVQQPL
jgi:hypothetical protein